MEQEAEVTKEIWLVLQKLKKYSLLTPSNEYIKYGIGDIKSIDEEEHRKILNKLKAEGVLKIITELHMDNGLMSGLNMYGFKTFFYRIDLVDEQFNQMYERYSKLNDGQYVSTRKDPYFDIREKKLIYNGKKCEVSGINRLILCEVLFLNTTFGDWVDEDDIASKFPKENTRTFYDAIRLFNNVVKRKLGIEEILKYEGSKVRIRTESFRSE